MARSRNRRARKGNPPSSKAINGLIPVRPSPFQANVRFAHKFRYVVTTGITSLNITRFNMLVPFMLNLSASTSNARLIASALVKRIEMYSMGVNSGSAPATIGLTWLSNLGAITEVSDTSVSSAYPAVIRTSPPRNSVAGFWSSTGSNESEVLFAVTALGGTIVDLWLDFVLFDTGAATLTTSTSSGGTVGQLVYCPMDGPGASSPKLTPVGVFAILN